MNKNIYFWLCSVFITLHRFSLAAASRNFTIFVVCGILLPWLLLLQQENALWLLGSVVAPHSLQSVGSVAVALRLFTCSMWGLPRRGIKPVSLALWDGLLVDYQQSPINLFSIELELIYNIMLVSSENIENFRDYAPLKFIVNYSLYSLCSLFVLYIVVYSF